MAFITKSIRETMEKAGLVFNMEGEQIIVDEPVLTPTQYLINELMSTKFPDMETMELYLESKYKIERK